MAALRLVAFSLILAFAGCASQRPAAPHDIDKAEACIRLFERADGEVDAAGVGDGGAARIAGFPWLRTSRFLASFRDQVQQPESFQVWIKHLADLDHEARGFELKNLGSTRLRELQNSWQPLAQHHRLPEQVAKALAPCRTILNVRVENNAEAQQALRAAAVAPDAYNTWQRVLGLYPLARPIARWRISALHEDLQGKLTSSVREAVATSYYAVPRDQSDAGPAEAAALVQQIRRDRLGIPQPDSQTRDLLFEAHAPIWAIETGGDADRPGALVFDADQRPAVDIEDGVEYRWLSRTRFGGEVLLQLNYALWFPERPPSGWIDIVAGHLDGIIWRTTLDPDGQVLSHDSIHPCGCYYALFPGEGWQAAVAPGHEEPLFAPRDAPVPDPGERLVLWLESGTRYFIDVDVSQPLQTHALSSAPMSSLRSLPQAGEGRTSVYQPDGLIAASRRLERFVLWPLGVPSAGAMRQPGTHAIAFVGRRHFDDAYLLEHVLAASVDLNSAKEKKLGR